MTEGGDASTDLTGATSGTSATSGELFVVEGSIGGPQEFLLEREEHQLKAASEAHKREMQRQRLDQELDEACKNSDLRRFQQRTLFVVVLFVVGLGLIFGSFIATLPDNGDTRRFGQAIVTLLLGAIAGYLTGRNVT